MNCAKLSCTVICSNSLILFLANTQNICLTIIHIHVYTLQYAHRTDSTVLYSLFFILKIKVGEKYPSWNDKTFTCTSSCKATLVRISYGGVGGSGVCLNCTTNGHEKNVSIYKTLCNRVWFLSKTFFWTVNGRFAITGSNILMARF